MSILIKGMEMPTKCADCLMVQRTKSTLRCPIASRLNGFSCVTTFGSVGLPEHCPLVEIPDGHGRLIDADALEQDAQKRLLICAKYDDQFQRHYEVMRAIALAPTVIPAEPPKEES